MWFVLRNLRRKHKNPKYIPTSFLKQRWERWEPVKHSYRLPDAHDTLEPISDARARSPALRSSGRLSVPPSSFNAAARSAVETASNNAALAAAGIDRNTSVRSVMTLPAYNQHAMQNEQVLAREGERGGIDVVVEFPEGGAEEEARREEEMEALYQVRLARRRENEEREERRRLRREARERGDYVALRELQARARASSSVSAGRTVEELRAEHDRIKKERQRAVSSVSYADLGVARHDGTRLRAGSMESEREGLLGDAASIAASSQYHRRDRSASSVMSIDTDTLNSDLPSPGLTRSRANSRGESSLRRVSTTVTPNDDMSGSNEGRAGSSPELIEHDDIPLHDPPGYENISLDTPHDEHATLGLPPDYSSPIVARGEGPAMFDSPATASAQSTRPVDTVGRRISASHIGQLTSDRRTSTSSSGSTQAVATPDSRRSSRGVGGIPQLPSLRISHLPSIHVETPSPIVRTIDEDDEPVSRPRSQHHPEE
ncbi:hypothetical protein D0Z07_8520 [Hyphodiscus hymeniophilus]|uniref:Uncharacterized protein n=1 Tax=Hyphodiscus hymeniophilus TaxID=353542 RepID=A0A9P6SPM2_9HELO|nr:hypothetical protein D0Z07_8520 [Hyphodiscus hymeniophilus]